MEETGGCLCGAIRFRVSGEPYEIGHCHCTACRRQTGAGYATYVVMMARDVSWEGALATYRSTPGVERGFCPTCGSTLSFARPDRGEMSLHAGTFDRPEAIRPRLHVFCGQAVGFAPVGDTLPRHDRFPPGETDREP